MQALYEDNIFKAETAYLEETPNGNIIKGFDNYIKAGVPRRKTNFNDQDRIFSMSSLTYASKVGRRFRRIGQLLMWLGGAQNKQLQQDESAPVTASSTPTVPDLPRLSMQMGGGRGGGGGSTIKKTVNNRKRKVDDESESVSDVETPGPKRVRISFSGQGGQGQQ